METDESGKEICEIKYSECQEFNNNLSIVEYNKKCGIINSRGEVICDFNYEFIGCVTYRLIQSN
jgi:hypothetical protein